MLSGLTWRMCSYCRKRFGTVSRKRQRRCVIKLFCTMIMNVLRVLSSSLPRTAWSSPVPVPVSTGWNSQSAPWETVRLCLACCGNSRTLRQRILRLKRRTTWQHMGWPRRVSKSLSGGGLRSCTGRAATHLAHWQCRVRCPGDICSGRRAPNRLSGRQSCCPTAHGKDRRLSCVIKKSTPLTPNNPENSYTVPDVGLYA